VLDTATQRALLRRWTSPGTHPHERLAGLLTLLHAASSTQIRALTITGATRTSDAPADGSYLSGRLAPAGTTPSACRQTRIAQLVNDLDPKLTATALGMRDSGLVRYLADNVARDRLQRTKPR
jgi:hypothetical protein